MTRGQASLRSARSNEAAAKKRALTKKRSNSGGPKKPALGKISDVPLYTPLDLRRPVNLTDIDDDGLTPEAFRSEFRRDYARLIHCPGFRRLQGKAQLFPCQENDFFRNRMSHSLEVAQIAKSIAIKLNDTNPYFAKHHIDTDLVEFCGLAHDTGHPPFGHNGESELDRQMLKFGGFEGNAQTLRILGRLEKKQTYNGFPYQSGEPEQISNGTDRRAGLNLTFRSLAGVLKYNRVIPKTLAARTAIQSEKEPYKGFYDHEAALVKQIKEHVVGRRFSRDDEEFKTIECSIMDVADDIAYLACTRFRRHRVRCFDGAGGGSWRDGSLRESSSLRLCA